MINGAFHRPRDGQRSFIPSLVSRPHGLAVRAERERWLDGDRRALQALEPGSRSWPSDADDKVLRSPRGTKGPDGP